VRKGNEDKMAELYFAAYVAAILSLVAGGLVLLYRTD
jgi:hypothetical protein